MMQYELHCGNSKELLKTLEDNSIDSIVTDPPYELGFMGKKWDASGIAYDVELWRECLRVLKHGGHLLAFSGSRTYHRMAVAIEDAGFDIRDQIMWLYGSGFPKSHDVSKAIDKLDAKELQKQRQYKFTNWVRSQNVTAKQIDIATNTCMGSHYTTHLTQPAIMTREHLEACRHLFTDIPKWVEMECDLRSVESENFKSREIVGKKIINGEEGTAGGYKNGIASIHGANVNMVRQINITAPATDAAKEWNGWGTALKPAHEPICVARKPLIGTVAENVLTHGTGAINVDACRVQTNEKITPNIRNTESSSEGWQRPWMQDKLKDEKRQIKAYQQMQSNGRWPANIIHDGSAEVLAGFPETPSSYRPNANGKIYDTGLDDYFKGYGKIKHNTFPDTKGSPARFFYCAKASKKDRDEGLEGFEERDGGHYAQDDWSRQNMGNTPDAMRAKVRNHHPTVKPTNLMQYLCRLVTPPNGLILDPFLGSGSTGKAAIYEGFRFIGFDLNQEYIDISKARIEYAIKMNNEHCIIDKTTKESD
jgi:DNA modification methylase